ncbi:MAG: DUF4265 domain-containing protein [Gammaproteobacteria bacterium]|nr:DUF4265 domain-containing protein [Gammaproteobacteria bacterium]
MPFLAGIDDANQPVFESLEAEVLYTSENYVRLLKSPLFARNLAAGDKIKVIDAESAEYELVQRSGNLCVRIFRRHQFEALAEFLSPKMEKLGASLDLQTDRALVFSIHFSVGFTAIEALLNQAVAEYPDTLWYYGNVYDPVDGTTPLLWWEDFECTSSNIVGQS